MRFSLILAGSMLIALGLQSPSTGWLIAWLGLNLVALGIAHWTSNRLAFGKRSNGTLPLWSIIAFLPLHVFTWGTWHLIRIVSHEPALCRVDDNLTIGRRLLPSEVTQSWDEYIDLTAEFIEPKRLRSKEGFRCIPILDGASLPPAALLEEISKTSSGHVFVHCAQGHGRTGLFAIALLIHRGLANSPEDGLRKLQRVRPGVRLSSEQISCLIRFAEQQKMKDNDLERQA